MGLCLLPSLAQAAERLVEYEVHVFTSDVRGAGTDGDVFLQLVGDKGAMGETKLENSANKWVTARVRSHCLYSTGVHGACAGGLWPMPRQIRSPGGPCETEHPAYLVGPWW